MNNKKLKLSEVITTLEMSDIENCSYYNKKTNEILWCRDDLEYNEDICLDENNIFMFGHHRTNDYEIMQDFISTIKDEEIKEKIYLFTTGSGAFKRFRHYIDHYNLINEWYIFRDNGYKQIAIEWLEKNEIEYINDLSKL